MNNKQNFLRKLGGAFWVLVAGLLAILMVSIVKAPGAKQPYYKPNVFPPTSFRLARENFTKLERELKEFVDSQPGEVGLYFFDLTTGGHFGINEKEPLPAASSIKVPVALYLYEQVAANKISLDEQMAYDPDVHWSGGAGTIRWNAYPGQLFTLGELARKLIRESDNVAWRMLTKRLGQDNIEAFMKNLGGKTVFPGGKNYSTAEDLVTYTRAALDFAHSNPDVGWILMDDLVHSIYKDGLPAFLPAEVQVGHKVGALPAVATDVGVVFLPERPYALAVMTKDVGVSEDPGFEAIAKISRLVYNHRIGKQNQSLALKADTL
jgi:beta-lactamase class A